MGPLLKDVRDPVHPAGSMAGADGQDAAAFGRGALLGLAVAHLADAEVTEGRGVGVAGEVDQVEHAGLVAAQAEGVGGLEQGGVAEGGQPPFAAVAGDAVDLVVGVVEERHQLGVGEGALGRVGLVFLQVDGGVPLVGDLDRVGAEPHLALGGPAVGGVGQVGAERADGFGVAAQDGAVQVAQGPQVAEPFVEPLSRPGPGEGIGMAGERLRRLLAAIDGGEGEVAGEPLVAPALHHRLEDLLLGAQQGQPVHQV